MIQEDVRLRKWGHSLGIVIPSRQAKQNRLRAGEKVDIIIRKKSNVLKEMFGTAKFKESTDKMMKEIDRLLYND